MYKKVFLLAIGISTIIIGCNQKPAAEISAEEIMTHINYLAGEECQGRFPGTSGSEKAANYIHNAFTDYNLLPQYNLGNQSFEVATQCELGEKNYLKISDTSKKLEQDFIPLSFSESTSAKGEVVFAGYGIHLESNKIQYNDYSNIDVNGKWVLILRYDPSSEKMHNPFNLLSTDRSKAAVAKEAGAIGVLVVNGVKTEKEDVLPKLKFDQNLATSGIPYIAITRNTANTILQNSNTSIEELESKIIEQQKPNSFTTNEVTEAQTDVYIKKVQANNIVYQINASKPTNNTIIIGAHYDHLGMGGEGTGSRVPDTNAVHYGADDNASGVAGIIELAGFIQSKEKELKHNIQFVAFDAEEMGTIGSKYFVNNTTLSNKDIVAMINLDMVGRMKSDSAGIVIGGTGTALEFDSLLNQIKPDFKVHHNPDGYGPSDHAPFYSDSIPVLFVSTGAHQDYHTPEDTPQKIIPEDQKRIMDYLAQVILSLDNYDNLSYQSTGSPAKTTKYSKLKVTLGIIPDMIGVHKNGLGVDGVRKGGPAEKGGILKGDKITAINGKPVGDIYEYMLRLSNLEAGKTAIIEVERNNKKEVLLIQL